MNINDLSTTIKPKSDQLNADDLISGPMTVTVQGVRIGATEEQPICLDIGVGHQPYKPCKSMRRLLVFCWGKDGNAWAGRSLTMFNDPEVKWAGQAIGGIRISHLSHIDKSVSVALTTTRGKRKPYTVAKLVIPDYDAAEFTKNLKAWETAIESGTITGPDLIAKVQQKGLLTEEQQQTILNITNQPADL
tara:strand:- start:552 stop:1121 length:570 start_codon:yes stop_codon:yes gene_type:complete